MYVCIEHQLKKGQRVCFRNSPSLSPIAIQKTKGPRRLEQPADTLINRPPPGEHLGNRAIYLVPSSLISLTVTAFRVKELNTSIEK